MDEPTQEILPPPPEHNDPLDQGVTFCYIVYGLFASGLFLVGGVPILWGAPFAAVLVFAIGVVIAYVKRGDFMGTMLESHYHWQINTFWVSFVVSLFSSLLYITVLLIPVAIVIGFCLLLWVLYRLIKGWLRLMERRPVA